MRVMPLFLIAIHHHRQLLQRLASAAASFAAAGSDVSTSTFVSGALRATVPTAGPEWFCICCCVLCCSS
jgi:hypothetical protein